jgi:transcriptional regulator with XRE-family HTH domain
VPKTPRLREWRARAALSQEELHDRSGVSRATIADLEAGNRGAQPRTIRKLAEALDVKPEVLYGASEYPLAEAPPSPEQPPLNGFEEERCEAISDLALGAAKRQARQDAQAAARAIESGRVQTYFMRHDNEALQRLSGYPAGELAEAVLKMAGRVVQAEQRPSPVTESLLAVLKHWLEIIADSPAENTVGAVHFALDLEDRLSVLVGDERQWRQPTPLQRAEMVQVMRAIEKLAESHVARMEAEADRSEVVDLDELRRRLEQSRESRRRAEAHSA